MRERDKSLITNLAHTAELVNTLNGGMSQPIIRVKKESEEWVVRMRIPGVDMDQLKIEIKNYQLFIFQLLTSENLQMQVPYLVATLPLTQQIDVDQISAEYKNSELLIVLPFDELMDGFQKEIDIVRK